jgi:hypothetical protein
MDRSRARQFAGRRVLLSLAAAAMLLPTAGCHTMLATGVYLWQGGNTAPAECEALNNEHIVVVCRPPSSQAYSYAGASRNLASTS